MYVAAAEGDGDLHDGRGDAYCGLLNCSYNLGLRGAKAYIPESPVGTAQELAQRVEEFVTHCPGHSGPAGAEDHRLRSPSRRFPGLQRPHQGAV